MSHNSRIAFLEKRVEELEAREALLVAQNGQSRELYERAPLSYQSLDEDGVIIDVNQAWLETLGYTREDVIGHNFSEFLSPDFQEHFKENFPKFKAAGEILGVEFDMVKKDGGKIFVSFHGKIGNDSHGYFQQTHCIFQDLTTYRKAQKTLLQSEALHRTLVNTIPDLVWLKDAEGVYLNCNKAFERFFGSAELTIVGKTDYDFLSKDIADSFRMHDRKAMEAIGSCVNEEQLTFVDGSYQGLFETIKTAMRDEDGNVIGILGISRDITERCNQDQLLKNLVRDQDIILNNVPSFIIFKDINNTIIKITESVAQATGLPKSEIEGRPSKEVYPDMADKYWEADLEVIRTRQPVLGLVEALPTVTGGTKWLYTDKVPYFVDDEVTGVLIIATDITALVEAENRLRESEEKFKSLFENAADAIYLVSIDGKILDVNNVALKQIGYSREKLLTMTVADLDPRATEENDQGNIWEQLDDDIVTISTHLQRKDGRRFPVEVNLSKIEMLGEWLLLAFVRDVTRKVEVENQVRQSQKLEAIGTLAGGIAHDFNNILAAILGFAELALDSTSPGSEINQDLNEILIAGHRAKELVKQILTFSKQGQSEKTYFQSAVIVRETMKFLRASLPTTIGIKQNIDEDSGVLFADSTQIHQILVNLCTNAYHAMEEFGGVLAVSLEKVTLSLQDLEHNSHIQPGNFVKFSVADNGSGIDDKIVTRIYDPFFSTKDTGKGTGLGLSIVHGLVQSYGGFIQCQSQPGVGTLFEVLLPAVKSSLVEEPEDIVVAPVGTEHILFLDDEKMLVDMNSLMLQRMGYRVTAHTSSVEALKVFANNPDEFDLVITDQTMPEMAGITLAAKMLAIRPQLPIILCTGFSNTISEEMANEVGIKGFAYKPIARKEISTLIRQVLDDKKVCDALL